MPLFAGSHQKPGGVEKEFCPSSPFGGSTALLSPPCRLLAARTVRESISAVRSRAVGDTLLWQLKGTNASRRCRELLRRFGVCHPPGTGLLLQGASAHDGTGRTEHTRSALAPVTGHPTAINRQRCRDARRVTAESAPRKHTAKIN